MADVDISYNNSVIASLSDSGTEVLETNGKFMTDDITVSYTKSGGGGGTTITLYQGSPLTSTSSSINAGGRTVYYAYYWGQAYIDSAKTTTVLEYFDYDGSALKAAFEDADKIVIIVSSGTQYYATGFEADTADDDYTVYYVNANGLGVQLSL